VRLAPCIPGASPTIRSRALRSPKESTGALYQVGCLVRVCSRNYTNLGQSGQLRSGSAGGGTPTAASVLLVEIVFTAARSHGRRALQELRRVMARFARGGAFGRIAAELGLQFDQVGEDVGLAP